MPYSVKSTDSLRSLLACAYTETIDQIQYEYFSVTDRTGSGALDNSFNGRLNKILVDSNLQTHLLEQVDLDIHTPVGLMIALLLAAAQGVGDRHLEDLGLVKGLLYIVELLRLNVGDDELHRYLSVIFRASG